MSMTDPSDPRPTASGEHRDAPIILVRERLRHPLEKRIVTVIGVMDVLVVGLLVGLLLWGAEWMESNRTLSKYEREVQVLVLAILAAPLVTTWVRRHRWHLAQDDSICVDGTQLPRLHRLLTSYCSRLDLPLPELYISDAIDHTTSFAWGRHKCIILSTQELARFPEAFEEMVEFVLAREVGSISLGHTSFLNELLTSCVRPVPFLKAPLDQIKSYSRDRFGAYLAPHAIRALLATVSGDPLVKELNLDAYFTRLEANSHLGSMGKGMALFRRRVPFARRVLQLRNAGLLRPDSR